MVEWAVRFLERTDPSCKPATAWNRQSLEIHRPRVALFLEATVSKERVCGHGGGLQTEVYMVDRRTCWELYSDHVLVSEGLSESWLASHMGRGSVWERLAEAQQFGVHDAQNPTPFGDPPVKEANVVSLLTDEIGDGHSSVVGPAGFGPL